MGMKGITEEIKEAIIEENKAKDNQLNYLKTNTITLPLEEFMRLYNSADELAKLLSIIFSNLERSTYRDLGVRLKDEDKLLEFIANYEPCVFQQVLAEILKGNKEEDEE